MDRRSWSLSATPDMAGTLDFNAYLFGGNALPVGDHRLVFVQPADELKIETATDAAAYKPGDEARVRFRVTNGRGEGVQAALGLQVVDEAVFALAEKQPGFAKVFFYLEQEAMKPRYEIHSMEMSQIVEPSAKTQDEQHDRAARALFSATEMVNTNKFETEFGRAVPQTKYAVYTQRYQAHFQKQVDELSGSLSRAWKENPEGGDLTKVMSRLAKSGRRWRFAIPGTLNCVSNPRGGFHTTTTWCAARVPDKMFNTADDLNTYVTVHSGQHVGSNPAAIAFDLDIEHDRGAMNGRAEIAGSVYDQSGAVIPRATVEAARRLAQPRMAETNDAGQLHFFRCAAGRIRD